MLSRPSHLHILVSRYVVVLCVVSLLGGLIPQPAAAQSVGPPPISTLALPRFLFPRHARLDGGLATNQQADTATRLHTLRLGDLGRVAGYMETGGWLVRRHYFALHYSASIFQSPDGAPAVEADILASAWEIGHPRQVYGVPGPTFEIDERDGHVDLVELILRGAVETEIVLRYGRPLPPEKTVLWYLWRITRQAVAVTSRFARSLPVSPQAPASVAPYVAPWGTGPVVKSPSLMTLDASSAPPGATLDSGAFRTTLPALARRAVRHAAMIPRGSLARYARTASTNGQLMYDAAALYPNATAAAAACDQLAGADHTQRVLQPYQPPPYTTPAAPAPATAAAWRGNDEHVVVLCDQNVVMIVASTTVAPLDATMPRLVQTIPSWLHAEGTSIVNGLEAPVHLVGLNWYGAEEDDFVVGGLDYQTYQAILTTIKQSGYNLVRLPFSDQLVEENPIVTQHLAANPELVGLHALDILDRIISYAGALGLSVVLDNHRSEAGWSAERNGLWYTPAYPEQAFMQDWVTLAQRYAVNNVVVGADLRNEPHGAATWGDGNPATDWKAAAERAGDAVLAVNPHLLIMVEGVQNYGTVDGHWWGENLMGVAAAPVELHFADGTSAHSQLVYSIHAYGPDNCHNGCSWFNSTTSYASLTQLWEQYWGYITDNPSEPYAAPVWVGEFGTCNYAASCVNDPTPGSQGQWFNSFVQYLGQKHLSWTYWAANGSQSTAPNRTYGALDRYGFLTGDWSTPNQWLATELQSIQSGTLTL